jgi:hypothetical protein
MQSAEQDEEKIVGNSSGEGVGPEAGLDEPGSDSLEEVMNPWEVRFEPGEKINPKVSR